MFREKVFGRNGGVLCGASDTVQAVDDLRQEAAGHPPRQVRVLLLQSVPAAVLSDERAQVVSHFLRGVSPCKQVEMPYIFFLREGLKKVWKFPSYFR